MPKSNIIILILLFIFSANENLTDGIYKIKHNNSYLHFNYKYNTFYFSKKWSISKASFFRIYNALDSSFYLIESFKLKKKIFSSHHGILANTKYNKSDNNYFWSFINDAENSVIIKNKNGCYIKITSSNKFTCNSSFEEASKFYLIKMYEEVKNSEEDIKLIEKEPIDVLIKYIDLNDPKLIRNDIHQIKKDMDNEELRYSIRSILENIPWIRKIFILMPNEKVRYLKEPDEIKEKIVYVKDKDLIGFDSSSSLVFQFRYWKMKEFNISDNFLAMDDDYFIGKPLNKTDFFYVKNKKVLPLITNTKFLKLNKRYVEKNKYFYKMITKKSHKEQSNQDYKYSLFLTYSFIMNIFKKNSIFVPKFPHNTIPINVNEIKEIYDLIEKSKYNKTTLYSTYRHIKSLQFQTLYLGFTFIKYQKKVHSIPAKYISFKNSLFFKFNFPLFCINTNAYQNSELSKKFFIVVMEKSFPKPSPYEIISPKSAMAINLIKQFKTKTKQLKKKIFKLKKEMINNQMNEYKLNKMQLIFDKFKKKKIIIYLFALFLVFFIKILIYCFII